MLLTHRNNRALKQTPASGDADEERGYASATRSLSLQPSRENQNWKQNKKWRKIEKYKTVQPWKENEKWKQNKKWKANEKWRNNK